MNNPSDFWGKVNKTDSCWLWTGLKTERGYGKLVYRGSYVSAHRLSWNLEYGPTNCWDCILHRCDNPPCVNPSHLFIGLQSDNMKDMADKKRSGRRRSEYRKRPIFEVDHDKIKRLLQQRGMKKCHLAINLDITNSQVSSIVRGKDRRSKHIPRIAAILGVSLSAILKDRFTDEQRAVDIVNSVIADAFGPSLANILLRPSNAILLKPIEHTADQAA